VHLYSNFWRKSRSNRASPKQFQADATSPALQRARAPARACRTPPRRPSPLAPSRGSFPEATHVPRPPQSPPSPRVARCPAGNAQRTVGPFLPPAIRSSQGQRAPPWMPRRVLWSLTGSLVAHIKGHCPPVPAEPRSSRHRRHYWPPRRAPGRGGYALNQAFPHLPLHPPKLAGMPILPAEPHRAGTTGCGGHRAWPPAPPLAGLLPTPSNPRNRPLGTQGPSPARARPAPAGGWPEFGRTAAARPPGTTLRREISFQGPCCKRLTQIVKPFGCFL
jgi:hypothetical protein